MNRRVAHAIAAGVLAVMAWLGLPAYGEPGRVLEWLVVLRLCG